MSPRNPKGIYLSIGLMGALVIGTVFLIHTTTFQRTLFRLAEKASGWKITIGKSRIKILRGQMIVSGLAVQNPKGTVRLQTKRLNVNLSPLSLLRGKVIITELGLDDSIVSVEKGPPGPEASDPLKKLWQVFEGSFLLQNLIFEEIQLKNFSIERPGTSPVRLERGTFRVAPSVFGGIELAGQLKGLGENQLSFQTVLNEEGLKINSLLLKSATLTAELKADWTGHLKKGLLEGGMRLEAPTVLSEPLLAKLKVSVDGKKAVVETLTAQLGEARLEATGTISLPDLICRVSFSARDLPLETVFGKLQSMILGPARGMAEMTGTVTGRITDAKIDANAAITDFRHKVLYARRAEGPVRLHWPVLDFDASVRPGAPETERVKVTGAVRFGHLPGLPKIQGLPQKIQIDAKGASLEEILPDSKLKGSVSGQLTLTGVETSVKGTGHARVLAATVGKIYVDLLETTVGIEPGGRVSFDRSRLMLATSTVSFPGTIKIEGEDPEIHFGGIPARGLTVDGRYHPETRALKISSEGTYPLEWLELFPDTVREASGTTTGTLAISGTTEHPIFKGALRFSGGTVIPKGFSDSITNLAGTLTSDGQRLTSDLKGNLGDGIFNLTGTAGLTNLSLDDFKLRLKGSALSLSNPGNWYLGFDGDLTLEGSLPSPLVRGRIEIVDGRYVKRFLVRELVLKPTEGKVENTTFEKTAGPFRLDLSVKTTGDLRVKNNIATILLASDLAVKGTYAEPRITGALTATEGTFHYLGQDFLLTEGRLEFSDPYRREPYLSLSAEESIPPTYTIFLQVKGYLSNLEVGLTSSPSLDRNNILSLLAFGMTDQEIRESGRSRQSLTSKVLAEEISTVIERPLTRATGFDIFRLEASEAQAGLPEGAPTLSRVSIGKNVTDRLSLEYRTDLAPETAEQTIQANYYLTDNVLLKGFRTRTATTEPRYQFNLSLRFQLQ